MTARHNGRADPIRVFVGYTGFNWQTSTELQREQVGKMEYARFVGLDVHRDSISVAVAGPGRSDPEVLGTISNDGLAVAKLVRRLGEADRLIFCYEAGPCGDSL